MTIYEEPATDWEELMRAERQLAEYKAKLDDVKAERDEAREQLALANVDAWSAEDRGDTYRNRALALRRRAVAERDEAKAELGRRERLDENTVSLFRRWQKWADEAASAVQFLENKNKEYEKLVEDAIAAGRKQADELDEARAWARRLKAQLDARPGADERARALKLACAEVCQYCSSPLWSTCHIAQEGTAWFHVADWLRKPCQAHAIRTAFAAKYVDIDGKS